MIFNTFLDILLKAIIYEFKVFVNGERFVLSALKKFEKFVAKFELLSLRLISWRSVVKLTRWFVRLRLTRWSAMNLNRWSAKMTRWSISIWWSISRIWKMWIRHNVGGSDVKTSKEFLIWKILLINVILSGLETRDVNMITSMSVEFIWW